MKINLSSSALAIVLLSSWTSAQVCTLVQDINPGSPDSSPFATTSVSTSSLVFRASDGSMGNEPFRWDAAGGVVSLGDLNSGSSSSFAYGFSTVISGGVQRTVFAANDGIHGSELWVIEGLTASLLKDIHPGASGASLFNFFYHPVQNAVYFMANDGTSGSELWRTDGTSLGTFMVDDINPGGGGSSPGEFSAFGGLLAFSADNGTLGRELWGTAGFPGGSFLISDINPGLGSSNPRTFAELGDKLIFAADNGSAGVELFSSDGTPGGTAMLKDIQPGSSGSTPTGLVTWGNSVYFSGNDGVSGSELWSTDGTSVGTSLLADVRPGSLGSAPVNLTVAAGQLFFSALNNGRELYKTDGTTAGTVMVADINPGGASSSPDELTPVGTGVYFEARGPQGSELYFSDGTASGTTLVCDIYPTALSSNPSGLVLCDGDLFFTADDATSGVELRRLSNPGAYVYDLGQAGNGSTLTATFPVLGSTATLSVEDTPVGTIGLIAMSAALASPISFLTEPGSVSWIDPQTFSILDVYFSPNTSINSVVPATPALVGLKLNVQAWAVPVTGVPASTSNGLQLILGN